MGGWGGDGPGRPCRAHQSRLQRRRTCAAPAPRRGQPPGRLAGAGRCGRGGRAVWGRDVPRVERQRSGGGGAPCRAVGFLDEELESAGRRARRGRDRKEAGLLLRLVLLEHHVLPADLEGFRQLRRHLYGDFLKAVRSVFVLADLREHAQLSGRGPLWLGAALMPSLILDSFARPEYDNSGMARYFRGDIRRLLPSHAERRDRTPAALDDDGIAACRRKDGGAVRHRRDMGGPVPPDLKLVWASKSLVESAGQFLQGLAVPGQAI